MTDHETADADDLLDALADRVERWLAARTDRRVRAEDLEVNAGLLHPSVYQARRDQLREVEQREAETRASAREAIARFAREILL